MANKNYIAGRAFEYATIRLFRALGYDACRTAGSHGHFDVIAIHPQHGGIELIQCKKVSSEAECRLLQKKFREAPPYQPLILGAGVHQVLTVKVKGSTAPFTLTI